MKIYTKSEIEGVINIPYLMEKIEEGLCLASQGGAVIAPVSSLQFKDPKGDVHIKSGALLGGDVFVIKIASGFYANPLLGLPSSNGAMLLFSQKTGALMTILLDEGLLTDLRTGLAGAIAAKYLAPPNITKIGIIGAGTQAREQLHHLQYVTQCRDVLVWGRDHLKMQKFASDPYLEMFRISFSTSIEDITQYCNLIVTTTPSRQPLLFGHQIRPGTHITAIGADDIGKQELDSTVFDCADLVVVDSLDQCSHYGDLSRAKNIDLNSVIELGTLILAPLKRQPDWITIADLTGIAIEDLQIANTIYQMLDNQDIVKHKS